MSSVQRNGKVKFMGYKPVKIEPYVKTAAELDPENRTDNVRYKHTEICNNCQCENSLYIRRGVTISDAIFMRECSKCGCYLKETL